MMSSESGHDAGTSALRLTEQRGEPVLSAQGERVGRVADFVITVDHRHPVVKRVRLRFRRRMREVSWEGVERIDAAGGIVLRPGVLPGEPTLERGEVLLGQDVLDCQIVDVAGKRIVRVGDVDLAETDGGLQVVAVEVGIAALLWRLHLRALARRAGREAVAWPDLHLTRRRELAIETPAAGLKRLRPEELATLVSRLPVRHGADILEAVDAQTAGAALAKSRPRLGGRLVNALRADHAGAIVASMPADDAVAALRHVRGERRDALLALVPSRRAAELRRLLTASPTTAGGLMTPAVKTARLGVPADEIRRELAADPPHLDGLLTVFVIDADGRLVGAIPPGSLLVGDATPTATPAVQLDTPTEKVIDIFALHDILALPVVDSERRVVGAVAVDDVLEELLVERLPGRRRFPTHILRRRAPA
jgi:CBS domain-containing protein/sporulation protein YlmC with PRC-barrel domain